MARITPSPSSQRHRRRKRQGHSQRQNQMKQRFLALGVLTVVALVLLVWVVWHVLLWFQQHPLAITALWVSALALGLLAVCGFFYWTFRSPPPGLRWRHPRRADLARYYDQRGTMQNLQTMDPLAFERFVGQLFELEGYQVSSTPRSGDGGVDLLLRRPGRSRRASSDSPALVQCKRYASSHSVGSPELQQFSGALRQALAHEGYFVTTSFFTPAAQKWARQAGIHLIDGLALLHWRTRLERRARLGLLSRDAVESLGALPSEETERQQEHAASGSGSHILPC